MGTCLAQAWSWSKTPAGHGAACTTAYHSLIGREKHLQPIQCLVCSVLCMSSLLMSDSAHTTAHYRYTLYLAVHICSVHHCRSLYSWQYLAVHIHYLAVHSNRLNTVNLIACSTQSTSPCTVHRDLHARMPYGRSR